jgi:hypothetical protein
MASSALAIAQSGWEQKVVDQLPLMGHRNWIVIVDSAYPLQCSPGVQTIDTGTDHLTVLDHVLGAINSSKHVRPIAHTDAELEYVAESDVPGVDLYRAELKKRLEEIPARSTLHEELIDQLNDAGRSFQVLVLKTKMTIPYSSVFLQLDCKYWSAESEASLRSRMNASGRGNSR